MKQIIVLAIVILANIESVKAQPIDSSAAVKMFERLNKPTLKAIEDQSKKIDSLFKFIKPGKRPEVNSNSTIVNLVTVLPVLLFLFIFFWTVNNLKKSKISLKDFMIDKDAMVSALTKDADVKIEQAKTEQAQANAIAANAQTFAALGQIPVQPQQPFLQNNPPPSPLPEEHSSTRLIAFLTGITSLAIAACVTSFYFYKNFTSDGKIEIDNLSTVLLALGLGVIPYGFNKLGNSLKG